MVQYIGPLIFQKITEIIIIINSFVIEVLFGRLAVQLHVRRDKVVNG